MGRCRIVTPETVRLPLSDGDFLDVQRELNAGDYVDLLTALTERKPFAKVIAYVLGWSLCALADTPIPYDTDMSEDDRRATIRNLDKATLREIVAALDRHEAAVDADREAKKKTPPTEPASSTTSGSVAP